MKSYPTATEAMRATLRDGNIPMIRERVVKKEKLDVEEMARDLGCSVKLEGINYVFTPGN